MPTKYTQYTGSPDIFETATGRYIPEEEAKTTGLFTPQGLSPDVSVAGTPRPEVKTAEDYARWAGINIGGTLPSPAGDLKTEGAVTTGELPEERTQFYEDLKDRWAKQDEMIAKITSLYTPTEEETGLKRQIGDITTAAEAGITEAGQRPAPMSFVTGTQRAIEQRANDKLNALTRQLQLLQGNREGQLNALKFAFDATRQNTQDAIAFYEKTVPEKIAIDDRTGTVYFQNPLTGEITTKTLPGYTPKLEDKIAIQQEYEYAVSQGYKGDFMQYLREKATQWGTEKLKGLSLPSSARIKLMGADFTPTEIDDIENDVRTYGIEAVLENTDDPKQKKAIRDAYGVKEKVTRAQLVSTVTQKMAYEGLKETYTPNELRALVEKHGYASFWTGKETDQERFLNSPEAKTLYIDILYKQYQDAGMAE